MNERKELVTPLGNKRYIIATTLNTGGIGDAVHLVTILSPEFLRTMGEIKVAKPGKEPKSDEFEVIYVALVKDDLYSGVIKLFQSKGILKNVPDIRKGSILQKHSQALTEKNPHAHIILLGVSDARVEAFYAFKEYFSGEILRSQLSQACFVPTISIGVGSYLTPLLQTKFGEHADEDEEDTVDSIDQHG